MKSSRSHYLFDQNRQVKSGISNYFLDQIKNEYITMFCVTKYHDCTNVVSVMLSGPLSSSVLHLASQMLEPTEQPL